MKWFQIEDGKKIPVRVNKHNTIEELSSLHEELSILHRFYESKTNFYKAKLKI